MKKEILEKLNNLKFNEISLAIPSKNENEWSVALHKENLAIRFSSNLAQEDLINITLESSRKKLNIMFHEDELEEFFKTIRQAVGVQYYVQHMEEEKRTELLNILQQAPTAHPGVKESITINSNNEEKKYYLRKVSFDTDESLEELSKIKYYHFKITELTRDQRLPNTPYESKEYNIILSNKEYIKVFNLDLKKEKEKIFTDYFKNIFSLEMKKQNIQITKEEVHTEKAEVINTKKFKNIL